MFLKLLAVVFLHMKFPRGGNLAHLAGRYNCFKVCVGRSSYLIFFWMYFTGKLWRINISPEKAQFQINISSSNHLFSADMLVFWGVLLASEEKSTQKKTSRIRAFFTENTLPKIAVTPFTAPKKKGKIYVPKRILQRFCASIHFSGA